MSHSLDDLVQLEFKMKEQSLVGDFPVFEKSAFTWAENLEKNYQEILEEFKLFVKKIPYDNLPNFQNISEEQKLITNDDNWKILPLFIYNEINKVTVSLMPKTYSIVNDIPGVTTCFFSVLSPGKQIPSHRGPYAGVLRCHLALIVPEELEKCWITVDGIKCHWKEGEVIIFDDTYEHEACNNTNETRVVLFIDFLRPLPPDMSEINLKIMRQIQNSDFVKNPKSNYEQWEKKHLAT